jgi:hypothetical protein
MLGTSLLVALGIVVYFLPSLVASGRKKRSSTAIFVLNLLLGWTLIGWVGALIWALTVDTPVVPVPYAPPPSPLCGVCNTPLRPTDKFCPNCATPINWNRG